MCSTEIPQHRVDASQLTQGVLQARRVVDLAVEPGRLLQKRNGMERPADHDLQRTEVREGVPRHHSVVQSAARSEHRGVTLARLRELAPLGGDESEVPGSPRCPCRVAHFVRRIGGLPEQSRGILESGLVPCHQSECVVAARELVGETRFQLGRQSSLAQCPCLRVAALPPRGEPQPRRGSRPRGHIPHGGRIGLDRCQDGTSAVVLPVVVDVESRRQTGFEAGGLGDW